MLRITILFSVLGMIGTLPGLAREIVRERVVVVPSRTVVVEHRPVIVKRVYYTRPRHHVHLVRPVKDTINYTLNLPGRFISP